jgi:hypothetical protein
MSINYKEKYLKYKNKYLHLLQFGGNIIIKLEPFNDKLITFTSDKPIQNINILTENLKKLFGDKLIIQNNSVSLTYTINIGRIIKQYDYDIIKKILENKITYSNDSITNIDLDIDMRIDPWEPIHKSKLLFFALEVSKDSYLGKELFTRSKKTADDFNKLNNLVEKNKIKSIQFRETNSKYASPHITLCSINIRVGSYLDKELEDKFIKFVDDIFKIFNETLKDTSIHSEMGEYEVLGNWISRVYNNTKLGNNFIDKQKNFSDGVIKKLCEFGNIQKIKEIQTKNYNKIFKYICDTNTDTNTETKSNESNNFIKSLWPNLVVNGCIKSGTYEMKLDNQYKLSNSNYLIEPGEYKLVYKLIKIDIFKDNNPLLFNTTNIQEENKIKYEILQYMNFIKNKQLLELSQIALGEYNLKPWLPHLSILNIKSLNNKISPEDYIVKFKLNATKTLNGKTIPLSWINLWSDKNKNKNNKNPGTISYFYCSYGDKFHRVELT